MTHRKPLAVQKNKEGNCYLGNQWGLPLLPDILNNTLFSNFEEEEKTTLALAFYPL